VAASSRLPKVRLGAVIAIGVAAGLGVWLATRDSVSSSPPTSTPTTAAGATGSKVVPITPGGLQTLVGALQRPIYWAGAESGKTYELTQSADGKVYLRYLPHGVAVGTQKAELTVGTYPVASAFSVTQRGAERSGSVRVPARGAVAFYNKNTPTNIYIAFPGTDYQIEVYDPSAAQAKELVRTGKIVPVAATAPSTSAAPALVSPGKLKAVARSLDHPLYWAGYMPGIGYELEQTQGDKTFVRYLPKGQAAGANVLALTVGTYGIPDAFTATQSSASRPDAVQVPVTGGGIAFYSKNTPTNVYVAYPGQPVQIEVYDPSPDRAKELVTTGKIVPLR
jgi:hypothetical protein